MRNPYIPSLAVIQEVREEAPDVKTFTLSLPGKPLEYSPGQFVELTVFGFGEFPVSIASCPLPKRECFEITVKRVGDATNALHKLGPGEVVGVRGPFGNGFPLQMLKGKNLIFIAGGVALAPLRSLILLVLKNKADYGDLKLLYGAKTPADLLYKDDLINWDMDVYLTVDTAGKEWIGNLGVVTTLFKRTKFGPENSVAVLCGPPIMIKAVVEDLLEMGFSGEDIVISFERMMKCGMGICGHCNIGSRYVCKDGPVFTVRETTEFLERAF